MHFSQAGLQAVTSEIRRRHSKGYQAVIRNIVYQIRRLQKENDSRAKLLVGISGGIDSTVVAYLATQAVGRKRVMALYLPASKQDEGMQYFPIVKSFLGIESCRKLSIEDSTKRVLMIVKKYTQKPIGRVTQGNIASRLRVNVLYAIAREEKALVLGTTNRTEFVQGYATKFGTPLSCDFGVLDELYKLDVYEIARHINLPAAIVNRVPTTGFFAGQTHEEELGASILEQDAAAFLLFEKRLSVGAIVKRYGASKEYLQTFVNRYVVSRHKRRLQPEHVTLGYLRNETS